MKFIVEKLFFENVENACFGIIIAEGINNNQEYDFIDQMLKENINNIVEKYQDIKIKELPEIKYYRDAFNKLNINPNKFMCSIEALVSRTVKTGFIPDINPIVNLGNALSLKYLIPIGLHDLDKLDTNIMIRFANPDDIFIPFGGNISETPDIGEVVYVSGNKVKTRRWIWRQGEDGKIDNNVKRVFIPLDGFIENKEQLLKLRDEFSEILKNQLGAHVKVGYIDKNNNEFEF